MLFGHGSFCVCSSKLDASLPLFEVGVLGRNGRLKADKIEFVPELLVTVELGEVETPCSPAGAFSLSPFDSDWTSGESSLRTIEISSPDSFASSRLYRIKKRPKLF